MSYWSPPYQNGNGRLVPPPEVVLQEQPVAPSRIVRPDLVEVPEDPVRLAGCHAPSFVTVAIARRHTTTPDRRV